MAQHPYGLGARIYRVGLFLSGRVLGRPSGPFAPDRLGFNLALRTLVYLSFQLLTIPLGVERPFHWRAGRDGLCGAVRSFACCDIWEAGASGHTAAVGGGVSTAVDRRD